jgi:hypothetical protein
MPREAPLADRSLACLTPAWGREHSLLSHCRGGVFATLHSPARPKAHANKQTSATPGSGMKLSFSAPGVP